MAHPRPLGLARGMLVYMFVIGELGGGDSRIMTPLAGRFSRIVFFGGLVYVVWRIRQNKKLLRSRQLLQQQMKAELDERNQYLHDKSGGIVADILLAILLFVTLTASMFDMAAFYTAFSVLAAAILLKAAAYWFTAVRAVNARSDDPGKPGARFRIRKRAAGFCFFGCSLFPQSGPLF